MTRRAITKALIGHAAAIAREHGVTVRLDPDGSITISPQSAKDLEEDELDRELAEFRRKHGYK